MKSPEQSHPETPAEEVASGVTHALGGMLASSAMTLLIFAAALGHDPRRIVSVSVYGSTLVAMYVASTCYHTVRVERLKRAMRVIDHASIYLLIAGTYTPIAMVSIAGSWGWTLFGLVWGLAAIGVTLKFWFIDRYEGISTLLYVLMGWVVLIALKPLLASLPAGGLWWLFGGGLAYTSGVAFFLWDSLPFNHAIWHLFVMAGSFCHFLVVFLLRPAGAAIGKRRLRFLILENGPVSCLTS